MSYIPPHRLLGLAAGFAIFATGALAATGSGGDIREFRVGLHVSELPSEGYRDFVCLDEAGAPVKEVDGWEGFRECPENADGFRQLRFEYDDSDVVYDDLEGTAVAGHPVVFSLFFGSDGVVEGMRIVTDPDARMYHKRKAYMLRVAVLGRFGQAGWQCENLPLEAGEGPVGTQIIKEACVRDDGDRRMYLETHMHRVPREAPNDILRSTLLEIWRQPTS